jgi:uroporphyrin-3 C-methyltransferase
MSEPSPPNNSANEADMPNAAAADAGVDEQSRRPPPEHGKGGRAGQMLFALAVVAAVGAGGYYLWHDIRATGQRVSADTEATRQRLDVLSRRTGKLEQQITGSLAEDIKSLRNRQQALEDSIANLRGELTGDARVWDVEEIATLLQIANDRLHLEKEVAPSLAALEAADRHLQALKNPALLEVRRLLADEITALRATAKPDIDGMALSLDALIKGIDRLSIGNASLKQTGTPATVSDKGWRGVLNDLWEKLKSLVSIQHRGQATRPLLAPNERYFLRQNLRLDLEAARIALLRRDDQTYKQTLRSAQEWITLYFDNDSPATAGALQELAHLQQTEIAPSLPDISGSLNALQAWLAKQDPRTVNHASGAAQP